jgi:hypothetical protein
VSLGGAVDTVGYTLVGMAAGKYPADATTDGMAAYLVNTQERDGRWRSVSHRPPTEYSDITTTALALHALDLYAPPANRRECERRIVKAAAWLLQTQPASTEERTLRLLGLHWARANRTAVDKAARELMSQQRGDGGWAQLSTLASDAYATGQALVALAQSGAVRTSDLVYRRGVEFLLRTQLEDGSWHVRTRSIPIMPYFESGFPHGPDQWISAFATGWASTALALSLEVD